MQSGAAFTVTQPANTVILDVGLIVTDAFSTGAGDPSFDVGTGAAGAQICDGANAVNNDASKQLLVRCFQLVLLEYQMPGLLP